MNFGHDIAELPTLTVTQLRQRYADLFGEITHVGNKQWLVKRIAWRWQAQAEGDLSERARERALHLANDADLRLNPPKVPPEIPAPDPSPPARVATDPRLPPPGSLMTRLYKGRLLSITVLEGGFSFENKVYASLSALAKAITGSHCNGFQFFGLPKSGGQP
jgi:Protein of unknown function (DUF2924)